VALDDDADLTWFGDRKARAAGEITDLGGRLLDLNGHSLSGVRIEIWQCDASGYYRHPRDRGGEKVDPNFQGHGHAITDSEGWYRFRTLKPVPYPGRTPHIHMATFAPGERPFVTQMYIAGESRNQDDFLYRAIPVEQRALVEAEFIRSASADADYSAQFDLVLGA
jgi:protocatechuate 3,4-dioxygenase beta subunit